MNVSGARVLVEGGTAMKYAPEHGPVADRLRAQADFIRAFSDDATWLPELHRTFDLGYTMERLHALPACVDDLALTSGILTRLKDLWGIEHLGPYRTYSEHVEYVLEKAKRIDLGEMFAEWWVEIWHHIAHLPTCHVHGDPTWDNCMVRLDGSLVITDPIPPGAALPSIRALDIAKVMQSIGGYEEVVKGRRPTTLTAADLTSELASLQVSGDEWKVVRYLTAVHFLRLLPYTPQHTEQWKARILKLRERA